MRNPATKRTGGGKRTPGFGIDSGPLTAFQTIFRCPNGTEHRIPLTTQQVDWNCDRTIFGSCHTKVAWRLWRGVR